MIFDFGFWLRDNYIMTESGIEEVQNGDNAIAGQIATALQGVLQQTSILPDFSRENPASFFSMLNTHFNVYGVREPQARLRQLVRKIPTDLLENLDEELNAGTTSEVKFEAVKAKIIKLLHKEPSQLLAKFLHAKKSPGTTLLRSLKNCINLQKAVTKKTMRISCD